jgi:MFS family permease
MQHREFSSRVALAVICLASAGWAFSFGLGAPLASLWLKQAGCSDTIIGLNTAIYYGGLAVAALGVPRLMRRRGHLGCVLGMALSGLAVALFPWGHGLVWWFGIRLVNGVAAAMSLIPMETYVNRDLSPGHRARNFGLYAVALTLGWALGNGVGLGFFAEHGRMAFVLGGTVALVAASTLQLFLPPIPQRSEASAARQAINVRGNLLSFGSAWGQGFLEGGMVAFLSLYLLGLHLSEQHVAWLTSTTMVGVIIFQIPVAWLADRHGRQPVLLVCYGLVAIGLVALPMAGTSALLPVWLFVVGACSGAFYPLGLALLGERLPASELARANAWYLSLECIGSLMGPALMGVARDWAGESAMFAVGEAAVLVVLAGWLWMRRRSAIGRADAGGSPQRAAA